MYIRGVLHVPNVHVPLDKRCPVVVEAILLSDEVKRTYFSSPSRSYSLAWIVAEITRNC